MNPDAQKLWRAPRWALAVLLAVLGMLGPFSIDTYLPAFSGIAQSLGASPVQMQQTLSAYLFGFAFMSLFHGAISDSLGRRPVVLWGLAAFTLASAGCALSQSIGQLVFFRAMQGLCTGAGIVVTPGVGLGSSGEGYVRFAITRPVARIQEAIERMRRMKL